MLFITWLFYGNKNKKMQCTGRLVLPSLRGRRKKGREGEKNARGEDLEKVPNRASFSPSLSIPF